MNFNEFKQSLSGTSPDRVLFLALGNLQRSDDAAGLHLANGLSKTLPFHNSGLIYAYTNPENHLQEILDFHPELVVCIDAARGEKFPGSIFWIKPQELDHLRSCTHAYSLTLVRDFINLHYPVTFKYLGIEPKSTGLGTWLSTAVSNAVHEFFKPSMKLSNNHQTIV